MASYGPRASSSRRAGAGGWPRGDRDGPPPSRLRECPGGVMAVRATRTDPCWPGRRSSRRSARRGRVPRPSPWRPGCRSAGPATSRATRAAGPNRAPVCRVASRTTRITTRLASRCTARRQGQRIEAVRSRFSSGPARVGASTATINRHRGRSTGDADVPPTTAWYAGRAHRTPADLHGRRVVRKHEGPRAR